jgi:hypothetical protein
MNTTHKTPHSSDPFADYERKNPFVDAMPARAEGIAPPSSASETWGPYDHIETLDDDEPLVGKEQALEILITWGKTVLHVAHLSPPRAFVVGDETDRSGEKVDFHLPSDVLGRSRLPLVVVESGVAHLVVPDVAVGAQKRGKSEQDLRALLANAPLSPTVTRAKQMPLEAKTRTTMKLGEFEFLVRLVTPSAPFEKGLLANFDWAVPSYFGMTAATMGGLMAALAYFVPPLGLEDESAIDKDRLVAISHYLDSASERERKQEQVEARAPGGEESGQAAERAPGEAGAAGKENSPAVNKRVAVKGPSDTPRLELSRPEVMKMAQEFGMIGILSGAVAADPNAPTSIFGGNVTLGNNDVSANGNLWADEIGEAAGNGALSLIGPGLGGGFGDGTGIGIANIGNGVLGTGIGKEGWGRSDALNRGNHAPKTPILRTANTEIQGGRIPPQVVQRIVRQNFGRFRLCYQQGLAQNPSLEGRIPVRFVIGRDGAVSNVSALGGFPDSKVQSCVQSAFYGLSFPAPEGGVVKVTYPLMFSPG